MSINKAIGVLAITASYVLVSPSSAQTNQLDDFALLDSKGQFHQFTRYRDMAAMLLFINQDNCELSDWAVAHLASFTSNFRNSIPLLALNHGSLTRSVERLSDRNIPVLLDETGYIFQALDPSRGGALLMLDPHRLEYRKLDKEFVAASEIFDAAQSKQLTAILNAIESVSCSQQSQPFEQHQQNPSYVADVAPILEARCSYCHRPGGSAPWAMSDHQVIQGWAPKIREVLLTQQMPPGQIDADPERFDGLSHITTGEMITLINWIDAGALGEELIEDEEDPLQLIEPYANGWQLGEPDQIYTFEEQSIPATGDVDYIWVTLETDLVRDKWVKGYEFDVGDPSVVHHARVFTQGKSYTGEQELKDFAAYAPGKSTIFYPDGIAQHFSSNDRLVMQIHYTTTGKVTKDQTRLGLHYVDNPPRQTLSNPITVNESIYIPAGDRNYETTASILLEADSYLYAMSPHMHYRGKSMKYTAVFPDGSTEQLLSVPNYQFRWQMNYWLTEPKFLPAGTTVVTNGTFDNSSANPSNPNANVDVVWGAQSWEEMFIGWMAIAIDNE